MRTEQDGSGWQVVPTTIGHSASVGDVLVYAIGDIHGRYDLFRRMLEKIASDAANRGKGRVPTLILCGDYIDRGPASAHVLEAIVWLERNGGYVLHALRGNHEQSLMDFIEQPEAGASWLRYGGVETLRAYGVEPPDAMHPAARFAEARNDLMNFMPASHHHLLQRTELMIEIGDYLFVHAGIRPGRPLDVQTAKDLLWIREDFLDDPRAYPKIIVHGHSWTDSQPQLKKYRIGIDTGVYATDVLTAVRLENNLRAFMQVGPEY